MAVDRPQWLLRLPQPELAASGRYERRWYALVALALGVLIIAIDVSIVGIAAPRITTALDATAAEVQWVFDAYTLVLAGFVLVGGGLGERYGRKGAFQVGLVVFAVGSLVSAYATEPLVLIGGRIVSGLGAATVFPTSLAMLSTVFEQDERPRAVGLYAAVSAFGLSLGPLVGGVLLAHFWVGSVFLVNVPVAVIGVVMAAIVVPSSRNDGLPSLDISGAVLSAIGLSGVVYALIEGPQQGWSAPRVLLAGALGLVLLVVFVRRELSIDHPLFDLRVLRLGPVLVGAIAMAVVYVTFNGIQLLLPQYLTYVTELSSFQAGLVMLPAGLSLAILSPLSARFVEHWGLKRMLTVTLTLMALGMLILAGVGLWGGVLNIELGLVVFGSGFGLVVAPATAAVMSLPAAKAGDGAAVNMVSRQLGGAVGVAILGSVAVMAYRANLSLDGLGLDAEQQRAVEASMSGEDALGAGVSDSTLARVDTLTSAATATGIQWAMLLGAAVCGAAAVAASRTTMAGTVPAADVDEDPRGMADPGA